MSQHTEIPDLVVVLGYISRLFQEAYCDDVYHRLVCLGGEGVGMGDAGKLSTTVLWLSPSVFLQGN